MAQKKSIRDRPGQRLDLLGMKVMLRWGKEYRFEKDMEDDIGRN